MKGFDGISQDCCPKDWFCGRRWSRTLASRALADPGGGQFWMTNRLGIWWMYKVVPQFRIAKLVNITPISLGFMAHISWYIYAIPMVYKPTSISLGHITLVTGKGCQPFTHGITHGIFRDRLYWGYTQNIFVYIISVHVPIINIHI